MSRLETLPEIPGGGSVAIKPAIAVALGKYLPKALKIVSDTLGKPKDE